MPLGHRSWNEVFVSAVLVVVLIWLLITVVGMVVARCDPLFAISLNENNRFYRNTGTIKLYDPFIEGKVLGEYKFVTGGAGHGSLPFGKYELGSYRDDGGTSFTRDSPRFRRRWMIKQPGLGDGEAVGGWTELELHSIHASGRTAGCIGVLGGLDIWDDFVSKMNYLISATGTVYFEIAANPDGTAGETYVASRRHPIHGKVAWHRHKHHKSDKNVHIAQHKKHKRHGRRRLKGG